MREQDDGRAAPPVTITGGPASRRSRSDGAAGGSGRAPAGRGGALHGPAAGVGAAADGASPRGRPVGLLVALAAVGTLLATVVLARPEPPEPPPPVEVALRLGEGPFAGSQSGVLLLPVDVEVGASAVRLGRTVLWGEPVRQQTALTGPRRFAAGSTGQLLVLVQPDCSLLAPSQGHALVLTADLEWVGEQGEAVREVLDLGAEPAVAARVAALCRPAAAG